MRIATRLLLLFIVIAIVFGAFFYMFYHIKHEELRLYREADLEQRRHTIDAIIRTKQEAQLQQTLDYAIRDETVTFMQNRDQELADENLKAISSILGYSLVQVYDPEANLIYSKAKDASPGLDLFMLESAITDSLGQAIQSSFFTRFHQHILSCTINSIHPSTDPEMMSPPRGYLLIANSWDYGFVSDLGKSLGYDVRLSYEEPEPTPGPQQFNTLILKPLVDNSGKTVAWLQFNSSNPFLVKLRGMGNLIIFGTMGFIFIFLLMQFFLIQQWISTPLNLISKSLHDSDPSQITSLKKAKNEFGAIAELIQRFFDQQEKLVREIEERTKSEIKVRNMEEQTRKILQTSPESIIVTDPEGKILDVNQETLNLLGFEDINSLISEKSTIDKLIRKKDRDNLKDILSNLHKGSYVKNRELYMESQPGKGFPGLLSASAIMEEAGKPSRFIFVTRDITDIRNLEQQLRQSQKMESIGTLAGGIAHDFNNIITIIAGYIALATGKIHQPKDAEHDLDAALKACLRAKSLIGKILTFSRQSEPDMEDLVLADVIEESLPMIRALLPTKIRIETKINSKSFTTADYTELQQVLINLSTNAYHAMRPDGGVLGIELNEVSGSELRSIEAGVDQNVRYLHLSVSDTGSGIAPDILSRIFDPYFSTKSSGEGTGLGLSIVHGIVTGYNGFITVRSILSEGTSVNIYLPINEHPQKKKKKEQKEDVPFIPAKLMIVDDEVALSEIFCEALQEVGYTVEAYTDSQKALAAFWKNPNSYSLVIADINMPQVDGIKLAEKIRDVREIPIILYTGFFDTNLQSKVDEAGIQHVLSKPILPDDMIREVKHVIYTSSELSS